MAPTRSSPYVCRAARVNTKNATSFLGHHISATFELRAGVVKARSPRSGSERSESLDDAEHSSTLIDVMAEAARVPSQMSVESAVRSARDLQRVRT